jgi:hypothetical protein
LEQARFEALQGEPHVVIEEIGQRQEHVVPRLGDRRHGEAEALVAPCGDGDVIRSDITAIVGFGVLGERGTQRRQAENFGIEVSARLAGNPGDALDQLCGRRIARHRLAQVDERPGAGSLGGIHE